MSRSSLSRSGFSMIGLLITMVCIVVLFSILMQSMNKAVTGQGSQKDMTVRSFQDKLYLDSLFKSMYTAAGDNKGTFLTPGNIGGVNDPSLNTTANLFSAMVMENYSPCNQLISGNEYSGYVEAKTDYDFTAHNPAKRIFWDSNFKADLKRLSNVSFGHMPLSGDRFQKRWRNTLESSFPLFGNRGPKDGDCTKSEYACGRDQVWRGHMVFGDGHIEFIETATPGGVFIEDKGVRTPDNLFIMETGGAGSDAVVSFTKTMDNSGPELQFD